MTTEIHPPLGKRIVNLIRFLLRLTFVVILAIGVGLGIYYITTFGIPAVYERYIHPIEENTLRLDDLEERQRQEFETLLERVETLHTRLTDLEVQNDIHKETILSLEAQLAAAQSVQLTQAAELAILAPLTATTSNTQGELEILQNEFTELSRSVDECIQQLEDQQETESSIASQLTEIHSELQMLRVMEFLTRGRFFLSQGNFALAISNILSAKQTLEQLRTPSPQGEYLHFDQIIKALDDAHIDLPDAPVQAADHLDGAWQLLIQGLPNTPVSTSTPTP